MKFNFKEKFKDASSENIYRLDGMVPVLKAIPFGLQHVLAMFVANVVPVMIIAGLAVYNGEKFTAVQTAQLIQAAMIVAGIGTLIQLYPIWRIGARLPVVMGLSFTFLSAMISCATKDYGIMVGAVIVGGCIEGLLGLTAKYWRKAITPIVSGCVVTTIGFSLLNVGIASLSASNGVIGLHGKVFDAGSWQVLVVGLITLVSCLMFNAFAKGFFKQLYVLFGLIVGYIVAICFKMVNFDSIAATVKEMGFISLPHLFRFTPKFDIGAIVSVTLVFLVSAAETIGDTTAVCTGGLGRDITEKEVSGSLACDGFMSAVSGGVFGCPPITSFSQNVGLVAMTKVVNRFTIMFGAITLILAGLFPPIGAFFSTLPDPVLGGCTLIMFGAIIVSGITMITACGGGQRNMLIVAISFCIGIGVTQVPQFFNHMPQIVKDIFQGNPVAGVFVVAMILSLTLPKRIDVSGVDALTDESIKNTNPKFPPKSVE
ncbi:MAG: nucleobase:cation symporter-2 family protein [Sphaerochaetaceae bacterium]|nr:nucleobase:cation symporter-2 family protein [Sphaerochaetaceae bacterium]